jgi:single-strand DNA-binding protein
MLNQTVLTGNLGADPEVFYSSEGNPVATFNLAFRSSKKKTGWVKCVTFGRLAEVTEKHLHRGARVGIAIGQLSKGHTKKLIKTCERANTVITVVTINALTKFFNREEIHYL